MTDAPSAAPPPWRLSVAPMMDWTDRHCRVLHRHLSRRALLYTEMVTAAAVLHGPFERLLAHDPVEHPLALQLGGSDPAELAAAVRRVLPFGFCEINLNVGCPSDRVQSGTFGACLMRTPGLVADCVAAMREAAEGTAITVKCRIGVDEQEPAEALFALADAVVARGVMRLTVHARKAWLQGLSPKENRTIPPLDHGLVARLKRERPSLTVIANGGIADLAMVQERLMAGLDGVMVGRAAYHDPGAILGPADRVIFGEPVPDTAPEAAIAAMLPYIEAQLAGGERLNRIARHMLGLFAGRPGARQWRRLLSEGATRTGAGPELVERALSAVAGGPAADRGAA